MKNFIKKHNLKNRVKSDLIEFLKNFRKESLELFEVSEIEKINFVNFWFKNTTLFKNIYFFTQTEIILKNKEKYNFFNYYYYYHKWALKFVDIFYEKN